MGTVRITGSTFSQNSSVGGGGAILNDEFSGMVNVTNSTISGNTGSRAGGGIRSESGTVMVNNSTLAENRYMYFGGTSIEDAIFSLATLDIQNTITSGSVRSFGVGTVSGNFNLFTADDNFGIVGTSNQFSTDPLLAPLADNGGPTQTHSPLPGSPAIDMGDPSIAFSPTEFDQRGAPFERVSGGQIDMGAFESQPIVISANFDNDGEVDGREFLAWQRGFGTSNAEKADGDADNDTDVDGNDLTIWKLQYGQPEPLVAMEEMSAVVSLSQGGSSNADSPTANTSHIDAALAMEWMNEPEAHSARKVVYENSIDEVFAADESSTALLPTADLDSELEEKTSSSEADETDDVWLSDELLESVFG